MTFWAVPSQVIKHGSTNTALKWSSKVHNGRLPIPPRPKKFRRSKSKFKTMLLTFFDIRGSVLYEFVPNGQTVNQVYYLEVLERQKRPKLFAKNSWILHHDNAPAHTALSVGKFLATKQISVLEHPAYSLDLATQWIFFVPEDKGHTERKAFCWHWWHRSNMTAALKAIQQNQFQNCFEGWTRHRCIASQGEYFEGDHSGIQQWGM